MTEPLSFGAVRPDDFRRIREVFESALEYTPAERAAFVRRACGGNSTLVTEVERMLAGDSAHHPLLDDGVQLTADRFRPGDVFAASFHIVGVLGRGGMGEVYRAHDEALNRDVALKILPELFARDPDRLSRFKREAQVLAALNHPNIAAIYGFEESDAVHALVLELVEGPTLAERIAHGALPLGEALPITRQIAEALEAAHEQGIVHRDLKPANIKLRPDGVVKVLDFGLAKMLQPATFTTDDTLASPTITSPSMVERGVILGSAAYVSPEQARGREADKRSDVWAFGAVLYEMLSGRRVFQGDDVSDTLASVLRQDIDWTALPSSTPLAVRELVARCLERDVKRRLRDIGEARIVLESPIVSSRWHAPAEHRRLLRPLTIASGVVLAAVALTAIAGIAAWHLKPDAQRTVTHLSFPLEEDTGLFPNRSVVAISNDGSQVVFATATGLYLRSMSSPAVRRIPGTEGLFNLNEPTFSPDGRSIAFQAVTDIRTIATTGGPSVRIAAAYSPYGMSWTQHGIFFVKLVNPLARTGGPEDRAPEVDGIWRVSPSGGDAQHVVRLQAGEAAHGPRMLPDGRHLLFTLATGTGPDRWDRARIVVQDLETGERRTVLEGGSDARYVPTGHLVYAVGGNLVAVTFDLATMTVSSAPVPVVQGVMRASPASTGGAQFSIADNGSLVYVPGPASAQWDVAVIDRTGVVDPLRLPSREYEVPRVSRDGAQVAFGTDDRNEGIIWTYQLSGASPMRRVTFGGNNRFPVWAPDGRRLAFQSDRDGDLALFWQPVAGGTPVRLTKPGPGEIHEPESWSLDGRRLLFTARKGSDFTLWVLSLADGTAAPFGDVHSSSRIGAVFSPDGRWVAYARSEGLKKNIYVQAFPATGVVHQLFPVGDDQPNHPLWSPDGTELFYNPGPGRFESVKVTTQPQFAIGNPVALRRPFGAAHTLMPRPYDITQDGKFVSAIPAGQSAPGKPAAPQIQVVLNWFEELRARVRPASSTP